MSEQNTPPPPGDDLAPARVSTSAWSVFAPACPPERLASIADTFRRDAPAFGMTTSRRVAHFLAQVAHESAGFTRLEENLSYSTARLMKIWPSRFPTAAAAARFARKPFALAERVYGGRLGNREAGDGWRFRGRGLIQITGRGNYAALALLTGTPLEASPSLAAQPDNAVRIALAFWCWKGCHLPADADDLEGVTYRINGGLNGLADRARWLERAKRLADEIQTEAEWSHG